VGAAEELDVVVVGAGQSGLAVSHELAGLGVEHVVLERSTSVGGGWSGRWDSFCLVTPNHTIRLPGGAYRGTDPHGYLPRDAIVRHLADYAASFEAPVRTGVPVTDLRARPGGGLRLRTADGEVTAREVVVATGAFQRALRPAWTNALPPGPALLESGDYRSPGALPPGPVLVVGSGQTGCQIAEELALAGRDVVLACGRAPWLPRRIEGRDCFDWILETPFFRQTLADLPDPGARLAANPQLTGAHGGADLSTRTLAALGVRLAGHLAGVADGVAAFADDLAASVAFGDARYDDLRRLIARSRAVRGLPAPAMPDPPPFDASAAVSRLDLHRVGSVILTAGFRPAYREWVGHPEAFDAVGFPLQVDGASTVVPGLSFVGVHFLRTRGSSVLLGVGEDAAVVAGGVASRLGLG
jgi:putative flavoprotein involved in K+ transport